MRTGPGQKTAPKESNIRAFELSKTFHLALKENLSVTKGTKVVLPLCLLSEDLNSVKHKVLQQTLLHEQVKTHSVPRNGGKKIWEHPGKVDHAK